MNFTIYRKRNRRIFIKPTYKKDVSLFKHCANGMESVTTRHFNKEVEHMLYIHGVKIISFIDRT